MKNLKKLKLSLIKCKAFQIAVAIVFIFSMGVFGKAYNVKAEEMGNKLLIKAKLVIDFPINTLPNNIKKDYENDGWKITNKGAVKEVILTDGEIYIGKTEYKIPNDGIVNIKNDIKEGMTISTDKELMKTTKIQKIDNKDVAIFTVNIGELFDNMDKMQFKMSSNKGYGDKYYPGDWVHCNRFNGPNSDDVHYRKTNPKAWINFVGSDCDLALARSTVCWGHSYCNQSGPAAGCSLKIGHSTRYHRHR